jgi:hypothetical protein
MSKLKNFAVETAKERVGRLVQIEDEWKFLIWVDDLSAWIFSTPNTNYSDALHNRSQRLIDCARQIMGMESIEYRGGDWRSYLN